MGDVRKPETCTIALLAGGKSDEREISLESAKGAREALVAAGYSVVQLDPANKDDLCSLVTSPFDAAFLCLHGKYGEDGCIQGLLELIGLPYTGSGVLASATALSKSKTKEVYGSAGVPTPPWMSLEKGASYSLNEIIAEVTSKCVVKAVSGGSTIGIFLAEGEEEIERAIADAFEYDNEVLIEQYVQGLEYTVAVIGGFDPEALPVIRIIPAKGFYDFEAKYAAGGSKHLCPAPVSPELEAQLKELSLRAHRALGCWGMSRTDFIVDDDGLCWALETNTVPGMTKTSLLPETASVSGIPFPELCKKLLVYAVERP